MNRNASSAARRYAIMAPVLVPLAALLCIYWWTHSLLIALPSAVVVTFLVFYYIHGISKSGAQIFFRMGGKAVDAFSKEQGLAKRGEREEACRLLLERFGEENNPEALQVCLGIATKSPVLAQAAMQACQGLIRHPDTPESGKKHYERILQEVSPDATGARHEI